jgi:hypothetical protein
MTTWSKDELRKIPACRKTCCAAAARQSGFKRRLSKRKIMLPVFGIKAKRIMVPTGYTFHSASRVWNQGNARTGGTCRTCLMWLTVAPRAGRGLFRI